MKKGRVAGLESSCACGSSAQETRNKHKPFASIYPSHLFYFLRLSLSLTLSLSFLNLTNTPQPRVNCADLFTPTQVTVSSLSLSLFICTALLLMDLIVSSIYLTYLQTSPPRKQRYIQIYRCNFRFSFSVSCFEIFDVLLIANPLLFVFVYHFFWDCIFF